MRVPASGCSAAYCSPQGHEAWHLVLGKSDLFTTELSQSQIAHLVVLGNE